MSDRINAIARQSQPTSVPISVSGLTMAYGDFVLMRDLNFEVKRGDILHHGRQRLREKYSTLPSNRTQRASVRRDFLSWP
jgi:hypothetical protein